MRLRIRQRTLRTKDRSKWDPNFAQFLHVSHQDGVIQDLSPPAAERTNERSFFFPPIGTDHDAPLPFSHGSHPLSAVKSSLKLSYSDNL